MLRRIIVLAPDILPEVVECEVTFRVHTNFTSFACLTGILLYCLCSVEKRSCPLSAGCPNFLQVELKIINFEGRWFSPVKSRLQGMSKILWNGEFVSSMYVE